MVTESVRLTNTQVTAATPAETAVLAPFRLPIDANLWRKHVEPLLSRAYDSDVARILRQRIRIGPCTIEFVGPPSAVEREFRLDGRPAPLAGAPGSGGHSTSGPDLYFYSFDSNVVTDDNRANLARLTKQELPAGPLALICAELGRALLLGHVDSFARQSILRELVGTWLLNVRRRRQPDVPAAEAIALRAAAIEHVVDDARSAGVLLLGASSAGKSTHAYLLAQARSGNAFLSDDWTLLGAGPDNVSSLERNVFIPVRFAIELPALLPIIAFGAAERLTAETDVEPALSHYHDASALARGIDDGTFGEAAVEKIVGWCAGHPDVRARIALTDWVTPHQSADCMHWTHTVLLDRDFGDSQILAPCDTATLVDRVVRDLFESCASARTPGVTARIREFVSAHCPETGVRLNTRLPIPLTQLCLRHYLDGRSDGARLLPAAGELARSIARQLRLDARLVSTADSTDDMQWLQGSRAVEILLFEQHGEPVEALAIDARTLDPTRFVDPFSQICAVWNGQIADFFTRHAHLRIRELFAAAIALRVSFATGG